MSKEEVQKNADELRSEAKRLFNHLFKIPSGYKSVAVERLVDCIIGCAMLETALVNVESLKTAIQKEVAK